MSIELINEIHFTLIALGVLIIVVSVLVGVASIIVGNRSENKNPMRGDDMTYEEAHKFLEDKQRKMTKNRGLYNETEIAINGKAIEAVEKQILKKVLFEADGYADGSLVYDVAICPNCGAVFENDYDWNSKYCPNCGQYLDWSVD